MDREILYTIGEVSELLNINSSKIRFWMKSFPEHLTCRKTPGGQRRFTESDYFKIRRIQRLISEERLTLDGVRKRLLLEKNRESRLKQVIEAVSRGIRNGMSEDNLVEKISAIIF
jgi:DNA-binding transcriptional MerR regulator